MGLPDGVNVHCGEGSSGEEGGGGVLSPVALRDDEHQRVVEGGADRTGMGKIKYWHMKRVGLTEMEWGRLITGA